MSLLNRILTSLFILIAGISEVWAFSWTMTPSIGAEVIYTDNVYLSKEKEDELIYRATPSVRITGNGNRASLNLDYHLNVTNYAEHSSADETTNSLSTLANIIFVKNLLFLDLSANVSQRAISNSEVTDAEQLSISDNYSEVITTTVSPYIDTLIGKDVRLMLRHSYENVAYGEASLENNDSEMANTQASISNASNLRRLSWVIDYSRRESESTETDKVIFERTDASLTVSPTAGWHFISSVGYESNDYETSVDDEETEGMSYGLGFQWQPTDSTHIKIMGYERYRGVSTTFDLVQTSGRTTYVINYMEDYTADSFVESEQGTTLFTENIGRISNEVFLQKRLSFNINRRFIRSNISLEMQGDEREYLRSETEEQTFSARLQWDRRMTRRTNLVLEGSWSQTEFAALDRNDNSLGFHSTLNHRLGRQVTASLEYDYLNHDSSESSAEYARNLYTLSLSVDF
jgi:hypothetical protein